MSCRRPKWITRLLSFSSHNHTTMPLIRKQSSSLTLIRTKSDEFRSYDEFDNETQLFLHGVAYRLNNKKVHFVEGIKTTTFEAYLIPWSVVITDKDDRELFVESYETKKDSIYIIVRHKGKTMLTLKREDAKFAYYAKKLEEDYNLTYGL